MPSNAQQNKGKKEQPKQTEKEQQQNKKTNQNNLDKDEEDQQDIKNKKSTNKKQPSPQQDQDNKQKPQSKQMRRIAERQELPTDKSELIEFLSQRIKQAQQALNDTEEVLQNEVGQRQKVAKSIEQRNSQLQKLYAVDQKGLPEKIKQKLTEILTQTINQKLEAEQELQNEKKQNYEYKTRYAQLKHQQSHLKHHLEQLQSKQTALNNDIKVSETSIHNHQEELKNLEDEYQQIKGKKQILEDKYLQMKVALERMNDLKAVINRFFSNQDLFDQKMELKPQQVRRPIVPNIDQLSTQKPQSRLPSRENRNNSRLKPLNNSRRKDVVDDDDFWKGDFTANNKMRNY